MNQSVISDRTSPRVDLHSGDRYARTGTLILCLLLVAVHASMFRALFAQWTTEDDAAHGIFVPVIAAWAAWEKRKALATIVLQPSLWGLALLFVGCAQALLADLGAELYLYRVSFLVSLVGLLIFLRGWATVRTLSFPLALLLFMFPIPGVLYKEVTFPLQLLASHLAEVSLETLGYTVLREGNLLEFGGQRLSVVEACSGVRSLLTLGFFSVSYAWFVDKRPWVRGALFVLSAPVAVLANAGRIVLTGVLGEYNQELAYGTFHVASGWGILIFATVLLIAAHSLLLLVPAGKQRIQKSAR